MTVELLHHTPLWIASRAIRRCWDSTDNGGCYLIPTDDLIEKDKELIYRVGNKNKHASTLEHINYTFDIDGISRALLQELARHRHASISVKSSRYTLKELKNTDTVEELRPFLVLTGDAYVDDLALGNLHNTRKGLKQGLSNDVVKYSLPEAYKTSCVWTINLRSLQNFLELRTNKAALWEIRELAYTIFDNLPEEHKYLLEEFLYKEER
jgi:thymidylate synthase (FAD)